MSVKQSAWCLEAPGRFKQRAIDVPETSSLAEGEVLLRVLVGGMCGSDLPYYAGRMHALLPDTRPGAAGIPGYPMHEVVGEVVASRDAALEVGACVVGWASHSNALAQFVVNAGLDLHAYDATFEPLEAITLQPLACVIDAVNHLGDLDGDSVTVLGQGSIGLLFSHVTKTRGARVVTGVDRVDRTECLADFRMDHFVHSSTDRWAANQASTEAPDVVIEAIGHQVGTLTHAIKSAAVNGRVYYFGIPDDEVYPVSMKAMLRKRLTLRSGWVLPTTRRTALAQAEAYLLDFPGLAKALISHVFPFDDVPAAFSAATLPRVGQRKIAIQVAS